jgi:hypothetical protein
MRAYTYIDRGAAIVGNGWIERRWNAFLGTTVGLVDKATGFDWINGECSEMYLDLDGQGLDTMALGKAAWLEDTSALGATLTCMHERPGLDVQIQTMAYHDLPVLLRTVRLLNKSRHPQSLRRIVLDSFAMRRKTFRALVHGFHESHPELVHKTDERAVALQLTRRGLILGCEASATYELCAPNPMACAVARDETVNLPEDRWIALPACYLIPYQGPVEHASRTCFAEFLAHRRELAEEEGSKSDV